jgi:hypothetical protein
LCDGIDLQALKTRLSLIHKFIGQVPKMINSIANSGLQGIQRGLEGLRQASATIASSDALTGEQSFGETTSALIESKEHVQGVKASARLIEADQKIRGALLDTFA